MKKLGFPVSLLVVGLAGFLVAAFYDRSPLQTVSAFKQILYYVDPMNPAHTSDKPGLAPCGMQMEPVFADEMPPAGSPIPGAINISAQKQQLIGVKLSEVKKTSGTRIVRTVGKVVPDETRIFRIAAPADGWVRTVSPVVTGNQVQRDDVLATFYNRDFLTAQQTYLYALNTMDRFQNDEGEEQLKLTRGQIRAAQDYLEFLGMGETQLREIARTREIARNVEFRAPAAGLVTFRDVFAGLRFERGTELFRIVQLDHIWVLADILPEQSEFQSNVTVCVTPLGSLRSYEARVSTQPPQFDPETRSLRLRLEVDNPGNLLRPDMYVDVELLVTNSPGIVIPSEAVLDTGLRKTVFVQSGSGIFEPRTVELGWRADGQVEIRKGLAEGEQIVISGNFLLDSETRMKQSAPIARELVAAAPEKDLEIATTMHPADAQRAINGVAVDPVCGMSVIKADARLANMVCASQDRMFFFCSLNCKAAFEKASSKYVGGSTNAAPARTPAFSTSPRTRKAKAPRDQ